MEFPDQHTYGLYLAKEVYCAVRGWDSFEPWLTRIEKLPETMIWQIAKELPSEWLEGSIEPLVVNLTRRRHCVRQLVEEIRKSSHSPFVGWE